MTSIARFVALLLFVTCSALAEQVTLLGINDLHANMERIARVATIVKEQRRLQPDLLLFSAGDHNTGDPASDLNPVFRGWPMIDIMNRLGVDVSCIGNHEFDGGTQALRQSMEAARFPFVCANMHAPEKMGLTQQPYIIIEHKGLKIGVLGVVTVSSSGYPSMASSHMAGLTFDDPIKEALKYKWLRDECDVLVLLTHIGYEQDKVLAAQFPEADVIIGGHTGTLIRDGAHTNGVLLTQAGDEAEAVTRITLEVEDGRVISSSAKTLMTEGVAADPEISQVVEEYAKEPVLHETLAENKTPLNRLATGSLICQALLEETGADVAVINCGGVRVRTLPAGPLTVADVYRLDPFCNAVVRVQLTGRELERMIQEVIDTDSGRPACVAGLQYDYQCAQEQNPQAVNLRLPDGRPIEPERQYTVATHSYVAETVLKPFPCERLDVTTEELMIRYLKKQKSIDFSGRQHVTLEQDLLDSL